MNQLSLFNIDAEGNMVLERPKETLVKPCLEAKYQKMISELDEYQIQVVEAEADASMSCIAGAGCLAGDTVLRINRAKKSFKITLKDLYLKFNRVGKHTLWDKKTPTLIRSFLQNQVIQLAHIKAVTYSGIKKTYLLSLKAGHSIVLTADHRVMTKRGWVEAQFLQSDDEILIDTLFRHKKTTSGNFLSKKRYLERHVGEYYAHAVIRKKRGTYSDFRAPEHRLIIEAEMNNLSLEDFIKATYSKNSLSLLSRETHVHHIDGNSQNNSRENLQVMSITEHLQYHATGYLGFKHGLPEYSLFDSFVEVGEQETYDIEMLGEPNFVANNIVVHNSGKTRTLISRAIKLVLKDNVDPTSIVLITFTNKAANELKERYIHFFKDQHPENCTFPTPHISTIHSFCLSQIRRTFGFNRTILSEYHSYKLFKEICQRIYQQEEGFTLEIKVINALYKIYQGLQSSLEILPICCPVFNTDGTLNRVVENYSEAKELDSTLLKKLPYFRLQAILSGKNVEQSFSEIIRSYLYSTPIREEVFRKICIEFLSEKYKNKTLDFTDMDFQYLLLMAQYPELRSIVHSNYRHIMQDESQDSSPAQFLTCVFADKESFEDFYKK